MNNHFIVYRIITMIEFISIFFAGGRQFNSLSDLVAYYTHCSDLLKRERLIHPTPPPEPVNDKKRIVAILPYTKMPDTDELTFQKGDIFFVHNDMGDGWLWVTAHRTGEQGLIFRELVDDLDDSIDPNTVFSWFHPNVTKSEAVDMLVKAGPGSFLVSFNMIIIIRQVCTNKSYNLLKNCIYINKFENRSNDRFEMSMMGDSDMVMFFNK